MAQTQARLWLWLLAVWVLLAGTEAQSLSERIASSIKERVASASNHQVINKNAEQKAAATAPRPMPKKKATYTQQKAAAEKKRVQPRKPRPVKTLKS
jgi:hypothetical protein